MHGLFVFVRRFCIFYALRWQYIYSMYEVAFESQLWLMLFLHRSRAQSMNNILMLFNSAIRGGQFVPNILVFDRAEIIAAQFNWVILISICILSFQ